MSDNTHIVVLNPVRRIEMKRLIKLDPADSEPVMTIETQIEGKENTGDVVPISKDEKISLTEIPSTGKKKPSQLRFYENAWFSFCSRIW